jgi:hypothetical protein
VILIESFEAVVEIDRSCEFFSESESFGACAVNSAVSVLDINFLGAGRGEY